MRVLDHVRALGVYTPNTGDHADHRAAPGGGPGHRRRSAQFLWDRGIYVTLAAYPLVPRDQVGFRVQVTAANTDEEIDQLNAVLTELAGGSQLRDAA